MTNKTLPNVAVLMATYNGLSWIQEQVRSIIAQKKVNVTLFISDDASNDGTREWLEKLSQETLRIHLLPVNNRFGSAGKNFYRLITSVNIKGYDYVAFSDQDDIWDANKLIKHINLSQKHNAEGVSSNVIAFWEDGKEKLIVKSNPQRKWDYLFESSGPGCTFLMTPWLVNTVREQLMNESSLANTVALHDWLTYAICRAHGRTWVIDFTPSLKYRQHHKNVVGANVGINAKWARLKKLKKNWYREEVSKIAQICNAINPKVELGKLLEILNSSSVCSRLKLLNYVPYARRRLIDRYMLALFIIVGLF